MEYAAIVANMEQEYAQKRRKAEFTARQRYDAVLQKYADVDAADTVLRRKMRAYGFGDIPHAEVETARNAFRAALALHGIDPASLEPQYACAKCQDTGKLNGRHCACFTRELYTRLYGEAYNDLAASKQDFAHCDLTVFPLETPSGYALTQRAIMEKYYVEARKYVAAFPDYSKQLLLILGSAGVGKTYLANCIAGEVMARGYSVLATSSFGLFDRLADRLSGKDADLTHIKEVDLLFIDDLGMEPTLNNFTLEYLFEILNTRQKCGRHTLITSNLSTEEIKARYTERIASRLFDRNSSLVIYLPGKDVRLLQR